MNESRENLRARLKAKCRKQSSTPTPNVDNLLMSNPELFNMANDVKNKSIPKMIQTLASKMASEGCKGVVIPSEMEGCSYEEEAPPKGGTNSSDEEEAPPEEGGECVAGEEEAPPPEAGVGEASLRPIRVDEGKRRWGDED